MTKYSLTLAALAVLSVLAPFGASAQERALTAADFADARKVEYANVNGLGKRPTSMQCSAKQRLLRPDPDAEPLPDIQLKGKVLSPEMRLQDALTWLLAGTKPAIRPAVSQKLGSQSVGEALGGMVGEGSLPEVIEMLSKQMGFFYKYSGNTLFVTAEQEFEVELPTVDAYVATAKASLEALGATDVAVEPRTRRAFFSANRKSAERIERHLARAAEDFSTVQMDVQVISMTLTDGASRGIQWDKLTRALSNGGVSFNSQGSAGDGAASLNVSMNLGKTALDVVLSFLNTQGSASILNQPKLAVTSGETQDIKVTRSANYLTKQTTATTGTAAAIQTSVTKEEVEEGLVLKFTPIARNGLVSVDITINQKVLTGILEQTIDGNIYKLPQIEENSTTSKVQVRSGELWAIAGLVVKKDTTSQTGVSLPFVGDAGGLLTSAKQNKGERTELVILVRPTIVKLEGC